MRSVILIILSVIVLGTVYAITTADREYSDSITYEEKEYITPSVPTETAVTGQESSVYSNPPYDEDEHSDAEDTDAKEHPTENVEIREGRYIAYNDALAKEAAENGKAVLFFHAVWCPSCKSLDRSIESGNIPNGITILKIDYDSSSALKRKYGVTYQHTLVQVDENLEKISKWAGSRGIQDIVNQIQ